MEGITCFLLTVEVSGQQRYSRMHITADFLHCHLLLAIWPDVKKKMTASFNFLFLSFKTSYLCVCSCQNIIYGMCVCVCVCIRDTKEGGTCMEGTFNFSWAKLFSYLAFVLKVSCES